MSEWIDLLHAELAQLGDRERVVVCHSLGCALWLRAAQPCLPTCASPGAAGVAAR